MIPLILSLICFGQDKALSSKFLAYFIPDKNGDYQFVKVFECSLPAVYADYGTFFTTPVFEKNMQYVGVMLSDTIFGQSGNEDIAIGVGCLAI